jgi:ATP-dependent RNA helicase DHX8/PRP22
MLLKECLSDRHLPQYGIIMLDETHERTIHTDVLFGLLKETLQTKSDLKKIVTSATIQKEKILHFFFGISVFEIPRSCFPTQTSFAKSPFQDPIEASIRRVLKLHQTEPIPGDILLFLIEQEDNDFVCEKRYEKSQNFNQN